MRALTLLSSQLEGLVGISCFQLCITLQNEIVMAFKWRHHMMRSLTLLSLQLYCVC